MAGQKRAHGALTHQVWQVLAQADTPMTPGQVREALDRRLAYTTVMTVLARLAAKGMVTRQRAGRAFAYTAVADRAELTAHQMRRLLHDRDDRATVLARFIDVISDDDERVLAELLAHDQDEEEDP